MAQQVRKWAIELTDKQRTEVEQVARSQKASTLVSRRAKVLLLADANHPEGRQTDEAIAALIGLTRRQVQRIRMQYVRHGLSKTLRRQVRSDAGIAKTMDGRAEAQLVKLCCSAPPDGRQRWTVQLLTDELCRLRVVASVCPETVRKTLKKIASSRGKRNASVSQRKTAPVSWPAWSKSSTSTTNSTTTRIP